MRKKSVQWEGPERICWVCCLMQDFVGINSLQHASSLLSGMTSVLDAPALRRARQALFNLRQMSLAFTTTQSLRHAVAVYKEHHYSLGTNGPYEINPDTLEFERTDSFEDPAIAEARLFLSTSIPYETQSMGMADPSAPMTVQIGQEALAARIGINPIQASLPPRRFHDLTRTPCGPMEVSWAELEGVARDMDECDAADPTRRCGNWLERFQRIRLMLPTQAVGLTEGASLRLDGIKHLIGLPGSGKTTLLMLLAVWAGKRHIRLMMLFPSIEVARQYLADLRYYKVNAGLLTGQHPATRRRHADRIAETIAASGDQGGFARTLPGASDFAMNCPLPAFSPDDTSMWGLGYAPCESILQGTEATGTKLRRRLCPVWTACARHKSSRELLDSDVWLGHVLSMDTDVSPQATQQRLRYFEFIARTFDLVIFDEADMVQANLDAHGAAVLKLTGGNNSIQAVVHEQVLKQLAGAENHRLMDRATEFYSRDLSEFGNHNNAMVHAVQRVESWISEYFAHRLLTTGRMITEILNGLGKQTPARDSATDSEVSSGFTRARALAEVWDSAAYAAFYDRNALEAHPWPKAEMCARVLRSNADRLKTVREDLINLFRRYLAENLSHRREKLEENIADDFLEIVFQEAPRPPGAHASIRILVSVTFMILGYQRIVPGMRTMVAEGLLREPLAELTASQHLRRLVPENILGSLSGVRYTFSRASSTKTAARNVELTFVSFVGAPRMLMHRFHRLLDADGSVRGPAVLMASATSFLEASPAYHVSSGPHFVLKSKTTEHDPSKSTYRFKWIPDPQKGNTPLRYSGAGNLATRNLEKMVDALARGGTTKSELYKAIRNFDVRDGIARKVALVVNGYEQARHIKRFLDDHHGEIGRRTKAVVPSLAPGETPVGFVTPAQVEALGDDDTCDIIVFPMLAIGRGVNIVFTHGPRVRQAAIGSIYFLTRPHPSSDDLGLLNSIAGRDSQGFDDLTFGETDGPKEITAALQAAKRQTRKLCRRLLEEPLMASRLGRELFKPFTANQMVATLQTIGRGMRGGCPVAVYFVDAAWAPRSTAGDPDSPKDSMLVQVRTILEECVAHEDPIKREIYRELYGAFLGPLRRVHGVVYPESFSDVPDDDYSEDGFDEFGSQADF
jgi:pPIWI RE three-gene island domain Z